MPAYLKFIISILVALVAWAAYNFGVKGGVMVPLLAVMMIVAVWLFPETRRLPEKNNLVDVSPNANSSKKGQGNGG